MNISTSRFGTVTLERDDILFFPAGLIGFERCCHWVLLADEKSDHFAWLQSISQPSVAMAIVSPRNILPDYRLHVAADEMEPLELQNTHRIHLLVIISGHEDRITFNLKAPLLINLNRRLGRQVLANDDQPIQYELPTTTIKIHEVA